MEYLLEPEKITVHLLFGDQDLASGWVKQYFFSDIPIDGSILAIPLPSLPLPGNSLEISKDLDAQSILYSQVIYSSVKLTEEEDSPTVMIVFGGLDLPDLDLDTCLKKEEWVKLDGSSTQILVNLCLQAPETAAIHNVLLMVGDPKHSTLQAWEQIFNPLDTEVPPFGSRIILDPADSMTIYDSTIRDSEGVLDERSIDLNTKGSLAKGLNSIVLHSEVVAPGIADLIYWAKDLGEISGLDLISEGWSQIKIPEDFDPEAIDIKERIYLAPRVIMIWKEDRESKELDEEGLPPLKFDSCNIENPSAVEPYLYRLLPHFLVKKCRESRIAAGLSLDGDSGDSGDESGY